MPKTFDQKHHGASFAGNPSRTAVLSDLRSVQNKQIHVALALFGLFGELTGFQVPCATLVVQIVSTAISALEELVIPEEEAFAQQRLK